MRMDTMKTFGRNNLILLCITWFLSLITCGLIVFYLTSNHYQKELDVAKTEYSQLWGQRNMYAELYYKSIDKKVEDSSIKKDK